MVSLEVLAELAWLNMSDTSERYLANKQKTSSTLPGFAVFFWGCNGG